MNSTQTSHTPPVGFRKRPGLAAWLPAVLTLLGVLPAARLSPAAGQEPGGAFLRQQRAVEEDVRLALNRELPADQKIDWDAGGWYSFYTYLWDDGIESSRTYRRHDVRGWTSLSLDRGAHQFYVRGRLLFHDFNSGDAYDGNDDDTEGPNLDRGFYQFDLRRAVQAARREPMDWNLRVKAGRDYVELGTGYALSLPMDHVLLTLEAADLEVQGLAGMSVHSTDDIERSRPGSGRMERCFWGGQVKYKGLERHEPFFYGFIQEDHNEEARRVPFQEYDYNSWYLGIGSTGEVVKDLRYATELVFEGGSSYGHRRWLTDDRICAWAYDLELDYLPRRAWKPRFSGAYMFAGGDGDRFGSPTDAVGGNTRGKDTGFSGFGYRDTGLAFGPRLSNVHVWRLGTGFHPLEDIEGLENLEVGTDWFLYCRNHGDGAVSDPTADRTSNYLGWEMDYFVNWRLTSDLAWTARLGTFFPGSAFSDRTTRTFFLTGVTWSF